MADTTIFVLEKCNPNRDTDFQEINFYHKSDLPKAEKAFDFLKEHGGLDYRIREITVSKGGDWEWKVVRANYELTEPKED